MESKNRTFLTVAGAVAAAIVLVLVVWHPGFPRQSASGAIGAVEKHHDVQITPQDVVLGDEAQKSRDQIAFAGYLNDAGKLQNIASQLGSAEMADRATIANATQELQSHQNDLQDRYFVAAKDTLNGISAILNKSNIANKSELQSKVDALASRLQNGAKLNASDMASFSAELNSAVDKLESNAGEILGGMYYYGGWGVNSNMVQDLGNMQSALGNRDMVGATAALQNAASMLQNQQKLGSFSLQSHQDYLNSISAESKTVGSAISQLGSGKQLGSVATMLNSQASQLGSSALHNMETALASQNQLASHLASFDRMVGSMHTLGSQHTVDNKTLGSFQSALSSFSSALQSRETAFGAYAQANMQAQLGSVESYLGSHNLADRASLGAYQSYLGNLSQSLQSKNAGLGSMSFANRGDLANRASDLANKASQLGSRSN